MKGGVLYHDGQFNDARMALALARTANAEGAVCVNYAEATGLLENEGKIGGAMVRDRRSGRDFIVRARGIVNACGPAVDKVRRWFLSATDCCSGDINSA